MGSHRQGRPRQPLQGEAEATACCLQACKDPPATPILSATPYGQSSRIPGHTFLVEAPASHHPPSTQHRDCCPGAASCNSSHRGRGPEESEPSWEPRPLQDRTLCTCPPALALPARAPVCPLSARSPFLLCTGWGLQCTAISELDRLGGGEDPGAGGVEGHSEASPEKRPEPGKGGWFPGRGHSLCQTWRVQLMPGGGRCRGGCVPPGDPTCKR